MPNFTIASNILLHLADLKAFFTSRVTNAQHLLVLIAVSAIFVAVVITLTVDFVASGKKITPI